MHLSDKEEKYIHFCSMLYNREYTSAFELMMENLDMKVHFDDLTRLLGNVEREKAENFMSFA